MLLIFISFYVADYLLCFFLLQLKTFQKVDLGLLQYLKYTSKRLYCMMAELAETFFLSIYINNSIVENATNVFMDIVDTMTHHN